MYKKLFVSIMLFILLLTAGCSQPAVEQPETTTVPEVAETQPPEKIVIGMMTIASHPSLDAVKQGVQDALKEAGYESGVNVEYIERNAEGDMATLATIAQQFVDEDVDLIVATSTPAAQAAFNATKDLGGPPVFYNAVSNPFIAELATTPEDHPGL